MSNLNINTDDLVCIHLPYKDTHEINRLVSDGQADPSKWMQREILKSLIVYALIAHNADINDGTSSELH